MKNKRAVKKINKNYEVNIETQKISKQDLELINTYSRKELKEEDLYTFNVVLCDNEIDRDIERFSVESLHALAKMFVGKSGIFDHQPKAKNQAARIYKAVVEQDNSRIVSQGEPYTFIKASAYMPITSKNIDLIAEIDAGIKKEVSISCCVDKIVCSVCGDDMRLAQCTHTKGMKSKDGHTCHGVLTEPTDAYEWSFVAVPAQPNAGVVKNFGNSDELDKEIQSETFTALKSTVEVAEPMNEKMLSKEESDTILKKMNELQKQADAYHSHLRDEVMRMMSVSFIALPVQVIESCVKALSVENLVSAKASLEKSFINTDSMAQLLPMNIDKSTNVDTFKI